MESHRKVKLAVMFFLLAGGCLYGQVDFVKKFDFSSCGYESNDKAIPFVKAAFAVSPIEGDATDLIQQAIVSHLRSKSQKIGLLTAIIPSGHFRSLKPVL